MRLSITTDDVSADLNSAIEVLLEMQCKEFELRRLGFDLLPDVDERWLVQAEKAVNNKRLRVTSLATDFFSKTPPSSEASSKLFAIAKRLRCNLISIAYYHTEAVPAAEKKDFEDEEEIAVPDESALEAVREFVTAASREGCEVMLRTHPDSYAATALEALAQLEAIGTGEKLLGLDWDVAGCFGAGDDSGLEHLEAVLPRLKTLRVRDAVRRGMDADFVTMGKGVIPWEDIIEQLWEGGYRGPVTLEPGVAPKLKEARTALTLVGRWIDACRIKRR
ncbi:MAG TPA: sugar phosphate isomerase/epimerase [Planctomycetota bacterium]|nr:sugar phosphate isomerase/epimerase [Planctomycetota bacterium]